MRFFLDSPTRARNVAKRLRTLMAAEGIPLTQGEALSLSATIYGYRDWQDLMFSAGSEPASLDDAESSQVVRGERRLHQVGSLVSAGLDPDLARRLVEDLHPTSVRKPFGVDEALAMLAGLFAAQRLYVAIFETQKSCLTTLAVGERPVTVHLENDACKSLSRLVNCNCYTRLKVPVADVVGFRFLLTTGRVRTRGRYVPKDGSFVANALYSWREYDENSLPTIQISGA